MVVTGTTQTTRTVGTNLGREGTGGGTGTEAAVAAAVPNQGGTDTGGTTATPTGVSDGADGNPGVASAAAAAVPVSTGNGGGAGGGAPPPGVSAVSAATGTGVAGASGGGAAPVAPGGAGAPAPGGGGGAGGGGAPGGGGAGGGGAESQLPLPLTDVGIVLTVGGASTQESQALEVTKQLSRLAAFSRLTAKDVTPLASRLEKRQAPANISLPFVQIKNIQALCFWAAKAQRQLRTPVAQEFTVDVLEEALNKMEIQETKLTAPAIKPDVLKEENWEDWSQEFPIFLSHITGKQNAALAYAILPTIPPVQPSPTEDEMYSYPLSGPFFKEDNREVYRLLSNRVKDQPATWIQPYQATQNDQAAWLALVDHYNGGGQKKKTDQQGGGRYHHCFL